MYTDERNAQIVIEVLKANNIRKIVASPGTTNASFIASLQNDDYFDIISAPEERSAAYIACGIAAQKKEPVVLSCTGATASRNYMPALTEAYYRKLPVLVITSSRRNAYIGHNMEQVTDRTALPNDVVNVSVQAPVIFDQIGEWDCTIKVNNAVLELKRRGGGPAHINLETVYSTGTVKDIKPVNIINRYTIKDVFPKINGQKIAVIVGTHLEWSNQLVAAVDSFCEKYNAIVLCDQTSNYFGKYKVFGCLAAFQSSWEAPFKHLDIAIHIGDVSAAVFDVKPKEVWRVNPDGELRDTFQKLKYVFEMEEEYFFEHYSSTDSEKKNNSFYKECIDADQKLRDNIPDLPLSNAWVAKTISTKIPENAIMHFGINNSLRVWNYFDTHNGTMAFANVGGFGIDGPLSSAIGSALFEKNKIVYCFLGDLAFFYDMNALGNRALPNNLRIVLINNGVGMEMQFDHALANKIATSLNANTSNYISAKGHYGNKSNELVKAYVQNLGFDYHAAHTKEEFVSLIPELVSKNINNPILVEVFVDCEDETLANASLMSILVDSGNVAKNAMKKLIGDRGIKVIKDIIGN